MVILDSVVSLEIPFFLYLKHVYQTSICCLLRLQVVLWNDLPIFYRANSHPSVLKFMSRYKKMTLSVFNFK